MSTLQTTIITTTNEPTTIFETTTMPPVTTLTAKTAPRINVTLSPSLNSRYFINITHFSNLAKNQLRNFIHIPNCC